MTKKPFLEVIDVGQGDCMIMRPRNGCTLKKRAYLIDTGDGRTDYSYYLADDEHIHLILTHSHKDHIGGIQFLHGSLSKKIREIIVPYYHDEIILISKVLQHLIGVGEIPYDSSALSGIRDYAAGQQALLHLVRSNRECQVTFAYDGMSLCGHACFLNPPIIRNRSKPDNKQRIERIMPLLQEPFASRFVYWLSARLIDGRSQSDTPDINRDMLDNDSEHNRQDIAGAQARARFVLRFFDRNYQRLASFVDSPSVSRLTAVVSSLHLTANQASLVLRYQMNESIYCGKDKQKRHAFLFTGDADKAVFRRLIKQKKGMECTFLKVPHHGSKHSLDEDIFNHMDPACAIISHGNAKFGRSKDAHPNKEVIDLLRKKNVYIFLTNDIVKDGKTILTYGRKDPYGFIEIRNP